MSPKLYRSRKLGMSTRSKHYFGQIIAETTVILRDEPSKRAQNVLADRLTNPCEISE